MENNVGDMLHCEEQLRTTLHCDDKEKLRRKLVLLQREYLRTAQRLQRAERSEAVQRHVRSRITQHNHQDQRNPEVSSDPRFNPASLTLDAHSGTASGVPQSQRHTGDPADSENSRRSQVIRFLLPSDAACPQTPDSSHDAARDHRPSPALRLRSRRSRLRWEKRSAEAGRSTENSEEGLEQSERVETARAGGSEEKGKAEGTEIVNESEELFSSRESESPSLLLTHWNTFGLTETGNMECKEIQGRQEQREKDAEVRSEGKKESEPTSLPLTCLKPDVNTEGTRRDDAQDGRGKEGEEGESRRGQRDGKLCDAEQNAAEKTESHDDVVEIKEEKSEGVGGEHDSKGASLLDSCTLVEGLLFPAEYYVRTTRRMTSSQSQPDMQAVILSQLNVGRRRRSRGRGRGTNRLARDHGGPDQHSQANFSSLVTASPSVGPGVDLSSELNSQSSSEISDLTSACQIDADACFSPSVAAARPARGRRRRRGRGRGRPQTPRCSLKLDTHQFACGQTSDDPQPTSSPVSSSLSLHGGDGPKPGLAPGDAAPVSDDLWPASIQSTATQPSSGGDGAQASSASGQQVYPIFLKSSSRTNRPTQMSRGAASWPSLLLPSSPPAQASLLPLPSLSPLPLVNNLTKFDILQDFHLPDDQFASLKLHKLRQVAMESGVEHFTPPYHNTRRSLRRSETWRGSGDPAVCLPLPLSLTPTLTKSPGPTEGKHAAAQSADHRNVSTEHKLTDAPTSQDCAADSVDRNKEKDTEILNPLSQSGVSASDTHGSIDRSIKQQPDVNAADRSAGKLNGYVIEHSDEFEVNQSSLILLEEQTDCPAVVHPLEDQTSPNLQTEDDALIKTLSFDWAAAQARDCSDALSVKSPAKESKESSEPTATPPTEKTDQDKCLPRLGVHSQLLLSPPLTSVPFTSPRLRSSALTSSPALPSLGPTPRPDPAALPLTSSPSAPALLLPPPHSPSTQALSPPALSPCPSLTSVPPSQPPASPAGQIQASPRLSQRGEPATHPPVSSIQSQGSGGQVDLRTEETAEDHTMRCTHTLKAPAGGCLVDACCLSGSSGDLCVAAAGKWAVCLWSQTAASDWSLVHTWAFSEPVINVFPVPDAAGLICVTLGQLEIREVRMLSCSSLSQVLLCEGLIQAVVGASKSRVVTSSHSASGSTLQVFTLSDSGSTLSSQPLASPRVCVGALAPVDGLSDGLIGTDEGGRLFIWNLKTGQLLRRIVLGDGLSHTACLRGYSYCGVLFVVLQHQFLTSLEEEEKECLENERKKTALFSLVAVNPLSGKSVLATQLYPPKAWSGRLCEADVNSCGVVGLSQSGCACVWELGRPGASRMVWAPESEGWQLARWGAGATLVTGHHNGDVTLHCNSTSQTSLRHIR